MTLKTFKPYTKSNRGTVVVDKSSLWKGSPYKPLTLGQKSTGGRNNYGRITSRSKGSGHKNKFRLIDFILLDIEFVLIKWHANVKHIKKYFLQKIFMKI